MAATVVTTERPGASGARSSYVQMTEHHSASVLTTEHHSSSVPTGGLLVRSARSARRVRVRRDQKTFCQKTSWGYRETVALPRVEQGDQMGRIPTTIALTERDDPSSAEAA